MPKNKQNCSTAVSLMSKNLECSTITILGQSNILATIMEAHLNISLMVALFYSSSHTLSLHNEPVSEPQLERWWKCTCLIFPVPRLPPFSMRWKGLAGAPGSLIALKKKNTQKKTVCNH